MQQKVYTGPDLGGAIEPRALGLLIMGASTKGNNLFFRF